MIKSIDLTFNNLVNKIAPFDKNEYIFKILNNKSKEVSFISGSIMYYQHKKQYVVVFLKIDDDLGKYIPILNSDVGKNFTVLGFIDNPL